MDEQKSEALAFRVVGELEALGAVPGLTERLSRGIFVADVGCGWGVSTVTMAAAFPRSLFLGVDAAPESIERARHLASERRVRNVHWLAAPAHQLAAPPTHDLICAFDCIQDMADPGAVLNAIHAALADDGVYLWSEPNVARTPRRAGRAFASVSPLHRTDDVPGILGLRDVRELAKRAGFSSVDTLPIDTALDQFFALRK